ncbi:hypothetical protein MMC08_003149 [Hypocenomyce scalaris]|nr:hypothetical protein [Hypocenomyce scalaris]
MKHLVLFTYRSLIGVGYGGSFGDLLKGIPQTNRYPDLVQDLPQDFLSDLKNTQQEARTFVCQILQGQVLSALDRVSTAVVSEASEDLNDLFNFIGSLPKLAPEILENIEQDGEDVRAQYHWRTHHQSRRSSYGHCRYRAGVGDVVGDIETADKDIVSAAKCFFEGCPAASKAAGSTDTRFSALVGSCVNVLQNPVVPTAQTTTATATSTYTPAATTSPYSSAAATATRSEPVPSSTYSPPAAVLTTTEGPTNSEPNRNANANANPA